MPINWSQQPHDITLKPLLDTRGTAGARPTRRDRGLPGKPAPEESALERWARRRGYALDFVPQPDAKPGSLPTQVQRGLAPSADIDSGQPRKPAPKTVPKPAKQQPAPRKPGFNKGAKPAPAPRVVIQSGDDTCWAAALESWLASADPTRGATQAELLKGFKGRDQSFDVKQFRRYVTAYGMDTAHMDMNKFTADTIREMLGKYKMLFISYHSEPTSPWWHDVVLYDVSVDADNQASYSVMNPSGKWREAGHKGWMKEGMQKWEKRHFFPVDTDLIIGWKPGGRPGKVW